MMNQAHEEGQRAPFHVLDRRVGAHPGEGHQQCGAEQRHDRRCVAPGRDRHERGQHECRGVGYPLRTNYGPDQPNSVHVHGRQRTPARGRYAQRPTWPDLGVKGSQIQISPARKHDGELSRRIRPAFIRPPGHPRQALVPGSWAQIGHTSASTPLRVEDAAPYAWGVNSCP